MRTVPWSRDCKTSFMLNSAKPEFLTDYKTKVLTIETFFFAFQHPDNVFIMPINVKMPTIVAFQHYE